MRSFTIAALVGTITAAPATIFQPGQPPKCYVLPSGETMVEYSNSALHPSFKCSHTGNVCSCTNTHPTHHTGSCKEFDHTSGKTHQIAGDCTASGLNAIDGGWSGWTPWGACSASCGGGTQARTRACNNPFPFNNGAQCSGEAAQQQACNTDECPCDADTQVQPATHLADYLNANERRPITTYPFYRDGNGDIVFSAYGFREKQSIDGCVGTGDKKVCLFTDPDSHISHFEFALPAGSDIACSLLHNEDDTIHITNGKSQYKYVMATDGGNNCGKTGTGYPCVKIFNNGENRANFMAPWASLTVQCVGSPLTLTPPSIPADATCPNKVDLLAAFADQAEASVAKLRKVAIYPIGRDGSTTLTIGDGDGTNTVLSNAFASGTRCTTGSNGMKVCTNSAKDSSHAQIEFSLPAGAGINCNLLHNEDDTVYESNGAPQYQLKMVTDGGNNCQATGTDKGCVKITNHGPATDVMPSWAGYSVQCVEDAVTSTTAKPTTAVAIGHKLQKTTTAIDAARISRTDGFYRVGSEMTFQLSGSDYKVAYNSCTTTSLGKACWFDKGFAWNLPAGKSINCQLLSNEDDHVYHNKGERANFDLHLATDGGNDCPGVLNGKAQLANGKPCAEVKNAGLSSSALESWASYKLYCLE